MTDELNFSWVFFFRSGFPKNIKFRKIIVYPFIIIFYRIADAICDVISTHKMKIKYLAIPTLERTAFYKEWIRRRDLQRYTI